VHGYDDPEIIAGQGTLGLEILDQCPDVDTVVVPVGGGGLIAGSSRRTRRGQPGARGRVQAKGAATADGQPARGERVVLDHVDTIADGLATRSVGVLAVRVVRSQLADSIEVDDAEIAAAILASPRAPRRPSWRGRARSRRRLPWPAAFTRRREGGGRSLRGNIDSNLLDRIIISAWSRRAPLPFTHPSLDRPGELQRWSRASAARCEHPSDSPRARPPGLPRRRWPDPRWRRRGPAHVAEIVEA